MSAPKPETAAQVRARVLAVVDAEAARLAAALAEHGEALRGIERENALILAEHDRAVSEARKRYAAAPPPPVLPDGRQHQDAVAEVMRGRQRLAEQRSDTLAAAVPDVETAWQAARPGLDAQARTLAAQVEALAGEYRSWWALLQDVRHAAEQPTVTHGAIGRGPSTRMGPRPGAVDVLAAAQGVDVCGVHPVQRYPSGVAGMSITEQADAMARVRRAEARAGETR